MQMGYSIILGEFVDAILLEHRDCEPFQVVCPVCDEPLFKVERPSIEKPIEYLSHYKKIGTYNTECELRADSKSQEDRQRHNSVSRNQKLEYFLKVLKVVISKDTFVHYSKSLDHTHNYLNKSKALLQFKREHFEAVRFDGNMKNPEQFRQVAQVYLNDISEFGSIPKTGFSIATQIRIASDIMRLLLTGHGRPNYETLFNHAVIHLIQRCQTPNPFESDQDALVQRTIVNFLIGIIESGKKRGLKLLDEMAHMPIYPPYMSQPTSYQHKIASEIGHEMIGTLIRLPYFELLKELPKN